MAESKQTDSLAELERLLSAPAGEVDWEKLDFERLIESKTSQSASLTAPLLGKPRDPAPEAVPAKQNPLSSPNRRGDSAMGADEEVKTSQSSPSVMPAPLSRHSVSSVSTGTPQPCGLTASGGAKTHRNESRASEAETLASPNRKGAEAKRGGEVLQGAEQSEAERLKTPESKTPGGDSMNETNTPAPGSSDAPLPSGRTAAQGELAQWFKKVKFKKALFGGVKEADVWKKLEQADKLYEAAIAAERARYDALLEAYRGGEAK